MATELSVDDKDIFALQAKLAWFKLSHALDLCSLLLGIIAALGVFFSPPALSLFQGFFGLSLVLSMVQKYYAMRVQYDIALFDAWLSVKSPTLAMLDDALQTQFGIKPSGASLAQRILGLNKLFHRQVMVNVAQLLLCLMGIGGYLAR